MKFYAVGYTNGGANEKRIGPFASVEEAKRNGTDEMNRNRGVFSFSGVIDDTGKFVLANYAPRSSNVVVANALKSVNSGCTNEYKARARSVIDEGYRELCEGVARLEIEADRLADISRSHGDKVEYASIMRKQSLLSDMVEKFKSDAQRLIDS